VTGLAQARRRWVCVATKPTPAIPGLTFRWPILIPERNRQVLTEVLEPTPNSLLSCAHMPHVTAPPYGEAACRHYLHKSGGDTYVT
jgi:hypothetical protein